jgi:hypothetical protein
MLARIEPDLVSHGGVADNRTSGQIVEFPVGATRAPRADANASGVPVDARAIEPTTLPKEIKIGGLLDPRVRLRAPLLVEVREEDGLISVWNGDLEEFGSGESLGDALDDFQRTVASLYFTLRDN